ncbi:hypothetical protein Tco_1054412, partial [Tanacetum coccineum]
GKGYRVIGLWGKVRGELGEVLERWFGAETVGKGGFDFGGYGVWYSMVSRFKRYVWGRGKDDNLLLTANQKAVGPQRMCAMLITMKAISYSPRSALQTESLVFERLFLTAHCKDEVWGLDHPRDVSVLGVGWRVRVTILPLLIEVKPPCFFTETETEYLTKRIQDGRPDVVQVDMTEVQIECTMNHTGSLNKRNRMLSNTICLMNVKEQRLEDVLGPFQKHFEALVNAESLDSSEGAETSDMISQGNNDHV